MKCGICGSNDAQIRLCEIETARITRRAHVDCWGHSEYRAVTLKEIEESAAALRDGGEEVDGE